MLPAFETLVSALEQDSNTPVHLLEALPLLMKEELVALGDGGPQIESVPRLLNGCLYDLVATTAKSNPDALAIVEPGREVTYRELVEEANGLAHRLIRDGVGPESRVALLADRSAESIIGMLGILAAGGAYVPLDPASPPDRLAFVLDNASAAALVTPTALAHQASLLARRSGSGLHVVVIGQTP